MSKGAGEQMTAWHTLPVDQAVRRQQVDPAVGLTVGEVRARLDRFGENRLREVAPRSAWLGFADQFKERADPVLIGAGLAAR